MTTVGEELVIRTSESPQVLTGRLSDAARTSNDRYLTEIESSATTMAIDPVCGMTVDPATAAASAEHDGTIIHFCSENCRRRFLANPAAYERAGVTSAGGEHCSHASGRQNKKVSMKLLCVASGFGLTASALILSFYFAVVTLVSGWEFTIEQFGDWWPYIVALAVGFGVQVGLFIYLRRAVHGAASGRVMVASGTTSGAAMVSCCTHYLVNLLPVLGATGVVSFVGTYQVDLFWFGIVSNLAGIAYVGRRVVLFTRGA